MEQIDLNEPEPYDDLVYELNKVNSEIWDLRDQLWALEMYRASIMNTLKAREYPPSGE